MHVDQTSEDIHSFTDATVMFRMVEQAILKRTTRTFQNWRLYVGHFVFTWHSSGVLTVSYKHFLKMLITASFKISFVKIA